MRLGAKTVLRALLAAGLISRPALAQNDVLIPAANPFGYNVGIDYETDLDGRTGRSITADLNQITQYFELVRTYHDTANPNSTTPTIDPNELQVIQFATSHPGFGLVMGTDDSALVTGTTGSFGPGLMDSSAYTDAWVLMLINAFGGTQAVQQSLKAILLGNEIDFPGTFVPGPTDSSYSTYVSTWIPIALGNLRASLSKNGLNVPVSVTLAYSPVSAPPGETVATVIPQYISANWSASWNGGQPFVLYDQYSNSNPPTFNDITGYLGQVIASPSVRNEVFLGETGVQSPGGNDAQEAAFFQQMFAFLGTEQQNTGNTLPAFVFQAFDLPAPPGGGGMQYFGIFSQDANSQPTGLKPGISIPLWVAQQAPAGSALLAAVLPGSRSVETGSTATAFATLINSSTVDASQCAIAPRTGISANFAFQTTNPMTNAPTGTPNTPVNIPQGGAQPFVIAFTPDASFAPTDVALNFACTNAAPAPTIYGLNTLLLSASTTPTPDVIALVATLQNDGIVHVTNGSPATGVFAVATDNIGSGDTITVAANLGEASLPVTTTICQTNPATGACLQTPSATVSTTINSNATPTFGIFVLASGTVPFDPTNNRIFVTFTDSTNTIRGETSVAVETQ
jgi:hypothetical protein